MAFFFMKIIIFNKEKFNESWGLGDLPKSENRTLYFSLRAEVEKTFFSFLVVGMPTTMLATSQEAVSG